jgi:hypothetical protein
MQSSLPDETHRLQPDHAPTPFSAEEIRAGCQPRRTIRLRVEPAGVEPFIRVNRFLEADAEGALQEAQRFALDGKPLEPASVQRVTWIGFQEHASFPEAATTIDIATIDLPGGSYACWRYVVREGDGERSLWFAKSLPGMPVRMEEREGDALTFRMVMLENIPGATLDG